MTIDSNVTVTKQAYKNHVNKIRLTFLSYDIREFTQEEFDGLPIGPSLSMISECELGTWFRCSPHRLVPEIAIVGQVVAGPCKMMLNTKRGVVYYRAVIRKKN